MIEVSNLVKEFKRTVRPEGALGSLRSLLWPEKSMKRAVDSISFRMDRGEMVGYIGPNGAGKSTSIKMLTGILVPTSGSVTINGLVPHRDRKRHAQQIGAVFGQKSQLWWDVPVIDSLKLLRDMYKLTEMQFRRNLDFFSELLELAPFLKTPVRQLSLGQRMRADLCAALMHEPDILFLDEPTVGVDVVAKEKLYTFIREVNRERHTTVLLTTHDLADIEKLCRRMMIIDNGQIIHNGSLAEFKARHGQKRTLVVEFEQEVADFDIPQAELTRSEGKVKAFSFLRLETSPAQLIAYISARYPILDLTVEEPQIDQLVRSIYEGGRA